MQENSHSVMKAGSMIVTKHSFLVKLLTAGESLGPNTTVDNQGQEM